jgi:hypothetical protein
MEPFDFYLNYILIAFLFVLFSSDPFGCTQAEDGTKTKQWYGQLQYHSQGMGAWRKRRNALANIMINGMMTRT